MDKIRSSARDLVGDLVKDGMTIAVGGFGLCGVPFLLIEALRDVGRRDLTVVSNNMGVDGKGLGLLLENNQVRKVLSSYVGETKSSHVNSWPANWRWNSTRRARSLSDLEQGRRYSGVLHSHGRRHAGCGRQADRDF